MRITQFRPHDRSSLQTFQYLRGDNLFDSINSRFSPVFRHYGLELSTVVRHQIVMDTRSPDATQGRLHQMAFEGDLSVLGAFSALGVRSHGAGMSKRYPRVFTGEVKRWADRSAAAVQAHVMQRWIQSQSEFGIHIVNTEGARPKVGEKGGNPSSWIDQIFGRQDADIAWGNVDNIDGTGKTVASLPSAITSLLFMMGTKGQQTIKYVPDENFVKAFSSRPLHSGYDIFGTALEKANWFSQAHNDLPLDELLLFSLLRPRHAIPVQQMRELGITFVRDRDGDISPVLASGLGYYRFELSKENPGKGAIQHPLHGGDATSGGGPEAPLAGVPLSWLGGDMRVAIADKDQFKDSWDQVGIFGEDKVRELREQYGYEMGVQYPISHFVENINADGAAVYGGITANYFIPGLRRAFFAGNFAGAYALNVVSSGVAWIDELQWRYISGRPNETHGKFIPLIRHLQELGEHDGGSDIDKEVQALLRDPLKSELLHDQFGHDYYSVMAIRNGKFNFDGRAFEVQTLPMGTSKEPLYTDADRFIIQSVQRHAPEWFESTESTGSVVYSTPSPSPRS